jgi:hypothetical protein
MKSSCPKCPNCDGGEFELRVLRDEAVAAVRCVNCSADFLLLDSKDYWFDVIQKGYPRLTCCSCKNEAFGLRIDYDVRDDGDINYVEVHSICSTCGKRRRQLKFEVDYSGTGHLLKRPLDPCKNPKILYDLKDLNLYLTLSDILGIVDHLAEQGCEFLSRVRREDRWVAVRQDVTQAKATIEKDKYLFVYAMPDHIEVSEDQLIVAKKEDALWKRSDVIRIGSKRHVCIHHSSKYPPSLCYSSDPPTHANYTEVGLLLYLAFSNEFVRGEEAVQKSESFRKVTAGLLAMLQAEFVSWRGRYCFDNPDVNVRVFGDRFKKKASVKKRR